MKLLFRGNGSSIRRAPHSSHELHRARLSRLAAPMLASICLSAVATAEGPLTAPAAQTGPAGMSDVPGPPPPLPAIAPPATEPAAPASLPALTLPLAAPLPAAATTQPASAPAGLSLSRPAGTSEAEAEPGQEPSGHLHDVVVTANLNRTRDEIAPPLGARTYTIGPDQIQSIPQGENAPFSQVLLRAPGVAQDSFGQVHVRGEHNNLTYRVNGILLPEGLNGFGQELDTRLINSVTLIDGSLPAQFGFRTAGIVDVTTKSGATLNHNEFSLYGGGYNTFQPSLQLGGTVDKLDYFVVASYNANNLGLESPTSSDSPLHDHTKQTKLFSYLSYRIDDTSRLSLIINASYSDFQIPDTAGLQPATALAGHPTADSSQVNENQNEQDYYAVVSYQKSEEDLSLQISGFTRYGQIRFRADPINDLIFQSVAGNVANSFYTNGLQFDTAYKVNDRHTLRGGILSYYTAETLSTDTAVFPVDDAGNPTTDVPFSISDNSGNWSINTGFYLQDEWKLTDNLTLNYGARYDRFDASFENADQISPRVNLVWKVDPITTAHIGYARYFAPPPAQFVLPGTIARFQGTTNAPNNLSDYPTPVERSHYFDVGVSRQIIPAWQVGLDGFYKDAKDLNDLGQFGSAVILSPYAYRVGHVEGAELSTNYNAGGFSLYGNVAYVETGARDIVSSQYLFSADELAFISSHDIKLDHDSEITASTGVSYAWKGNRVYADLLYGSGLRKGFANTGKEPQHYPVNIGFEHKFDPGIRGIYDMKFRFDILNVFDQVYQIRDGSGIGVGAAQYGQRRTFLAGLTIDF